MQKSLHINADKCTGCLQCEMACSYENYGVFNTSKSRIKVFEFHLTGKKVPYTCTQCSEAWCLQACPVDAIVGASKQMHVVLTEWCTGCDLCIPPCPVDCISMINVTGDKTGWEAWSPDLADLARKRYHEREMRLDREQRDNDDRLAKKAAAKLQSVNNESPQSEEELKEQERKRAIIAAAIARAQEKK